MRYLKVNTYLTIRVPKLSIESADYIFYKEKDLEWAFNKASSFLSAKLEALSDWQTKVYNGRSIHYRKIKVVHFWTPEE